MYPLRLTGVGNGPLSVDLYIFAGRKAAIPGWETVRSAPVINLSESDDQAGVQLVDTFPLAHEELLTLVGDPAWMTRLQASLSPEQMKADAYVEWVEPEVVRRVARTPGAAFGRAMVLGLGAGVLVSLFALCKPTPARPRIALFALAAIVGVFSAGFVLDPAEVVELRRAVISRGMAQIIGKWLAMYSCEELEENSDFVPTVEWARSRVREILRERGMIDPDEEMDERWREEDSPWRYVIRTTPDEGVEFVDYGPFGEAHTIRLDEP